MDNQEKTIEVLNDLIRINNDRIEGYTKAIEQTDLIDADLRMMFENCRSTSEDIKGDLLKYIARYNGEPATDTTNAGKLHRAWMDVKKAISTESRETILESCEYGEDVAQKVYKMAIEEFSDLPNDVNESIASQKKTLKTQHDLVKKARDAQKLVNKA